MSPDPKPRQLTLIPARPAKDWQLDDDTKATGLRGIERARSVLHRNDDTTERQAS